MAHGTQDQGATRSSSEEGEDEFQATTALDWLAAMEQSKAAAEARPMPATPLRHNCACVGIGAGKATAGEPANFEDGNFEQPQIVAGVGLGKRDKRAKNVRTDKVSNSLSQSTKFLPGTTAAFAVATGCTGTARNLGEDVV